MLKKIARNVNLMFSNEKDFWTKYNVTLHRRFESREESLGYLRWRNAQYLFYEELMPTDGFDGKVVLDYGCGPCHDIVGFLEDSRPRRIVGVDISPTSLQEGRERLRLHESAACELRQLDFEARTLPFPDTSFDYIHSSGVLHHIRHIDSVLAEFHRVLADDGFCRIMVYNYDSIWLHLHAAYMIRMQSKKRHLSLEDAFRISTDTRFCPVSRCYTQAAFIALCAAAGFTARLIGCAIALEELKILPGRFAAIQTPALEAEHREFLRALEFDSHGRPLHRGEVAGIDACYELTKA
jgi:ubiquinone/menaquinone biosynthesis C-methylase UbiE